MKIEVATLNKDGSARDPSEILKDVLEIGREIHARHCFALFVNGKATGHGVSADMPGLTEARAIVLYKEMLDAANDTSRAFLSPARYNNFGVFKRNASGAFEPVASMQHTAVNHRQDRRVVQRPRWVR